MYKILDTDLLEITGRQSDVIELALTYGFGGINVDMVDLFKRCQRTSFESATRFLVSSKLVVASFALPVSLDDDDTTFANRFEQMKAVSEIAGKCKARCGILDLPNGTDRLPYPEYFDVVRKRIDQIADLLAAKGIRLALRLNAACEGADKQFKFIREVSGLLALVRSCTSKNVCVVLDSWNWHLGGGLPSHLDDLGIDRVAIAYLSDCKEGVDAAAATAEDRLLPGSTGVIDNAQWLGKLKGRELGVAAYGASSSGTVTRDAYISQVQDALNEALASAGIPVNSRRPENFAVAAESYSEADFKE
jgi:sugar phosphate isomerase/epimerase